MFFSKHCEEWKLVFNVNKTKVMVFRKRDGILGTESCSYNENVIEIVDQFNNLGFVISTNDWVKKGIDMLAVKARKSMRSLLPYTGYEHSYR